MAQMIPVAMSPHSDRSGSEKKKKLRLPTALMRRRAMAASHVFLGIPITVVPRWGYSLEADRLKNAVLVHLQPPECPFLPRGTITLMNACSVLRCLEPATSSFTLAPYSGHGVPVCSGHKNQLDAGTRWMANSDTPVGALLGGTYAGPVTILMGQDLPTEPLVQSLGLTPTIGSESGYSLNVGLETSEGEQSISFWLTEEQGKRLGSWLIE